MIKVVVLHEVRAKDAIAVSGFPGMGLVGKTVADFLIKTLNARPVARIYSTKFPAQLVIRSNAIADLNRVDIYFANHNGKPLFIVTSDTQPIHDEDQHELSYRVAKYLANCGVRELIATAAFVTEVIVEKRRVFVTGSDEQVMRKYIDAGAEPLNEGVVTGMNGVIVGWAAAFDIEAVCLLGETWRSIVELNYVDYGAAKTIVDLIARVWNMKLETLELMQNSQRVEAEVRQLVRTYLRHLSEKEEKEERKSSYYIT